MTFICSTAFLYLDDLFFSDLQVTAKPRKSEIFLARVARGRTRKAEVSETKSMFPHSDFSFCLQIAAFHAILPSRILYHKTAPLESARCFKSYGNMCKPDAILIFSKNACIFISLVIS